MTTIQWPRTLPYKYPVDAIFDEYYYLLYRGLTRRLAGAITAAKDSWSGQRGTITVPEWTRSKK